MSKINFLQETLQELWDDGKSAAEVKWIGNCDFYIDWDDFAKPADFEYDSGFGSNEISMSLIIVGDNWWLERNEYDGSEWWEFKTLPTRPKKYGLTKEDILEK